MATRREFVKALGVAPLALSEETKAKTGFVYDDIYLEHVIRPDHVESPERLRKILAEMHRQGLHEEVVRLPRFEAPLPFIERHHTKEHVARVLAVDGQPISQWYDMTAVLAASADTPVTLAVGRPGGRTDITLTPEPTTVPVEGGGSRTVGRIGVYPKDIENRFVPLSPCWGRATGECARLKANRHRIEDGRETR